jgi:flavin-binding protein dodecin
MTIATDRPTAEFVGASDETIGEAVRRALARAATALRTLEGAGVLVIPQVYRRGVAPRFRVTLKVTAPAANGNGTAPKRRPNGAD